MSEHFVVRQARPGEREDVLRAAYGGFGQGDHTFDFRNELPYLWNEERTADHWLCLHDAEIVGLVGVYPFGVRLAGVEFRAAGIGQVTTMPHMRGRGVMTRILRAAAAQMDGGRYDFTWLWGDRRRYGHFGWATGGVTYRFESNLRYLPDPPPEGEVRTLDPDEHLERIYGFAEAQAYAVHFSVKEFRQLVGRPGTQIDGWRDAWVLHRPGRSGRHVWLADGPEAEIAGLLSHLARGADPEQGTAWVVFTTGPFDCPLMRVGREYYARMQRENTACLRICDLAGYFTRAARVVQPRLIGGTDELSVRNVDNGLGVRIACRSGQLTVEDSAGARPRDMTTTAISEAVFGTLPLEVTMPGLPPDSPLRALFELPVHVNHLFAL